MESLNSQPCPGQAGAPGFRLPARGRLGRQWWAQEGSLHLQAPKPELHSSAASLLMAKHLVVPRATPAWATLHWQ